MQVGQNSGGRMFQCAPAANFNFNAFLDPDELAGSTMPSRNGARIWVRQCAQLRIRPGNSPPWLEGGSPKDATGDFGLQNARQKRSKTKRGPRHADPALGRYDIMFERLGTANPATRCGRAACASPAKCL